MAQYRSLPVAFDAASEDDTIIRQSTIGQMFLCPLRWGLKGEPGFLEPVSEKMAFGTCLHYMLEKHLTDGIGDKELLNMREWVEPILIEDYDWTFEQIDNPREFFNELALAYRRWLVSVEPKIKGELISAEEEIFLPLGQGTKGRIVLKGTPDVIYSTRLYDWKTAGEDWKRSKAELSIQASLYLALAKQSHDLSIKNFTFYVYDRRAGTWNAHSTKRTAKQIDAALMTAYRVGLQVEAEIFPATPVPESAFNKRRGWYCSAKFCPAWNICDSKYLADDVDERELAIRSWS